MSQSSSQNVEDFSPNCCPSSVLEGAISTAFVSLWLFSRPPNWEHYREHPPCPGTQQQLVSCSLHSTYTRSEEQAFSGSVGGEDCGINSADRVRKLRNVQHYANEWRKTHLDVKVVTSVISISKFTDSAGVSHRYVLLYIIKFINALILNTILIKTTVIINIM